VYTSNIIANVVKRYDDWQIDDDIFILVDYDDPSSNRISPIISKPVRSYGVNTDEKYANNPLLRNIVWPRPCAYKGAVLKPATYYRGQGEKDYAVWQNNASSNVLQAMGADADYVLLDGKSAKHLGTFQYTEYSIHFTGDKEDDVGNYTTIIRDCNAFGRLLELTLEVNILANAAP
jgi:hypothetical protein